jgi:hypothetical protein
VPTCQCSKCAHAGWLGVKLLFCGWYSGSATIFNVLLSQQQTNLIVHIRNSLPLQASKLDAKQPKHCLTAATSQNAIFCNLNH